MIGTGPSAGAITVTASTGTGHILLIVDQATGQPSSAPVPQTAVQATSYSATGSVSLVSSPAVGSLVWSAETAQTAGTSTTIATTTSGFSALDSDINTNTWDFTASTAYMNGGAPSTVAWSGLNAGQVSWAWAMEIALGGTTTAASGAVGGSFTATATGVSSLGAVLIQNDTAAVSTSPSTSFVPTSSIAVGHGLTMQVNSVSGVATNGVSSSNGDSWQHIGQTGLSASIATDLFFCAESAGGSPTITITTNANESSSSFRYNLCEWSVPLMAVLGENGSSATGTTASTGNFASGTILAVIDFHAAAADWSSWPPSGWTNMGAGNASKFAYQTPASNTTLNPSMTLTSSVAWATYGASFYVPTLPKPLIEPPNQAVIAWYR